MTGHLDLLRPAIEAVRAALRDLDADQVPADLRRVAAYAGGRLPPPLARAVLKALDRYDWLRERAAASLPDGDDPASEASAAWLERSAGWSATVARLVEEAVRRSADEASADDRDRIAGLEERIEEVRRVGRRRLSDAEEEVARLRGALEEERGRRRAVLAEEARIEAQGRREVDEVQAALADVTNRLEAARAEVERLGEVERRLRRERSTLEHALAEATTGPGWLAGDPAVLAGHLDELARMAKAAVATDAEPGAAEAEPGRLALPAGVRPDGREAIDWLLGLGAPATVVVDGYNAGFHLTGSTDPGPARRRLGLEVDRLGRLARGPLRVVVVYDSSVDTAPADPGRPGPEIRFTAPDVAADDEIARLAARLPGRVVVLSSDRWVREVAEAAGAVALWSEALVDWAATR
ncbi:MAG: NYN domain-containing protein [Acidimicrobiia bacterium]|nr:NYN domain-containing protein [Acidimicrobiia bacterium]